MNNKKINDMKTTAFLKRLSGVVAAVLAVSCQQFDIDTQPGGEIKMESDALEAYTFAATNPQPATFSVSSTTPWKITGFESVEWCDVTPASSSVSSLSEDVMITLSANQTLEDRAVTLTLSGEGIEKTWTITVTQDRKGKLYVQPVSDNFASSGSTLPFTIETNLPWEVRSADLWLTFDQTGGEGDGSVVTVNATAAMNTSAVRKTTVTVTSGDETREFEVTQKGISLVWAPVETAEVDRTGGELILEVDASIDWKVESSDEWFTVEKISDTQAKVSAAWNNIFAPRTAQITLLPASSSYGDIKDVIEVSQDINFELSGEGCTVLEDGSVKITGGSKSKVYFKDEYRYHKAHIEFGGADWGDDGELWYHMSINNCNIYNQHRSKNRLRTDGETSAGSTYANTTYTLGADALAAMTSCDYDLYPDETDPAQLHFDFYVNGEIVAAHSALSAIYYAVDDETGKNMTGTVYFGNYNTTSSSTYYIIKSCDITPIAE